MILTDFRPQGPVTTIWTLQSTAPVAAAHIGISELDRKIKTSLSDCLELPHHLNSAVGHVTDVARHATSCLHQ